MTYAQTTDIIRGLMALVEDLAPDPESRELFEIDEIMAQAQAALDGMEEHT